MKIVDAFIFYNELDLLNYRLNYLNEVVDFFVIVESTHTFTGKPKPLFYVDNKDRFKEFESKIIHILVQDFPHVEPHIQIKKKFLMSYKADQWQNEFWQRDAIDRGIKKLNLNDDDVVVVTDVDEIPNIEIFKKVKAGEIVITHQCLNMDFYCYNLTMKCEHGGFPGKILNYATYKAYPNVSAIRRNKAAPIIDNAGWHLSYFGDQNYIKNKIASFSHQEYNRPGLITDLTRKFKEGIYPLSENVKVKHIKLADNTNLPHKYETYLTMFLN